MRGDQADFVSRLRRVLPTRWFGDAAPMTDAVLNGLAAAWSAVYALIETVRMQARLLTASGSFIDAFAADFFGMAFPRWAGESDGSYQRRISLELLRPRATRGAVKRALEGLTGQTVSVFEPARPSDTGGYNVGGLAYCIAGGYGNLSLHHQCFVVAARPTGGGIAALAGYGTGGVVVYGDLSMANVPVSDDAIYATAASVLPSGTVAWLRISG